MDACCFWQVTSALGYSQLNVDVVLDCWLGVMVRVSAVSVAENVVICLL